MIFLENYLENYIEKLVSKHEKLRTEGKIEDKPLEVKNINLTELQRILFFIYKEKKLNYDMYCADAKEELSPLFISILEAYCKDHEDNEDENIAYAQILTERYIDKAIELLADSNYSKIYDAIDKIYLMLGKFPKKNTDFGTKVNKQTNL